ncbi:MAG: hypothetical protein AAGJ18_12835, partial [Bacteroidota bacterium]
ARLTVFSRFLIMMLIVGPLAFLGASYYNGEDGIETIKNVFNQNKEAITETRTNRSEEKVAAKIENTDYDVKKLQAELDYKQRRLEEMFKENEDLKQKIDQLEKLLENNSTTTSSSKSSSSSNN